MGFASACGTDTIDPTADAASDAAVLAETDVTDDVTDDVIDTEGVFTISLNVAFPVGAVTAGYLPVAAVYKASDYSDFELRPETMPMTALLGTEESSTLEDTITDFGQTATYEFPYGEYSVVVGIAETIGLPKPVKDKMFIGRTIRTDKRDTLIVITADDPDWAPY
jgi:hypothetical protein